MSEDPQQVASSEQLLAEARAEVERLRAERDTLLEKFEALLEKFEDTYVEKWRARQRVKALEAAASEALEHHAEWCGFNKNAPGHRSLVALRQALKDTETGD
jgi:predicted  nucleic acid-binding Zn-ribbon protein